MATSTQRTSSPTNISDSVVTRKDWHSPPLITATDGGFDVESVESVDGVVKQVTLALSSISATLDVQGTVEQLQLGELFTDIVRVTVPAGPDKVQISQNVCYKKLLHTRPRQLHEPQGTKHFTIHPYHQHNLLRSLTAGQTYLHGTSDISVSGCVSQHTTWKSVSLSVTLEVSVQLSLWLGAADDHENLLPTQPQQTTSAVPSQRAADDVAVSKQPQTASATISRGAAAPAGQDEDLDLDQDEEEQTPAVIHASAPPEGATHNVEHDVQLTSFETILVKDNMKCPAVTFAVIHPSSDSSQQASDDTTTAAAAAAAGGDHHGHHQGGVVVAARTAPDSMVQQLPESARAESSDMSEATTKLQDVENLQVDAMPQSDAADHQSADLADQIAQGIRTTSGTTAAAAAWTLQSEAPVADFASEPASNPTASTCEQIVAATSTISSIHTHAAAVAAVPTSINISAKSQTAGHVPLACSIGSSSSSSPRIPSTKSTHGSSSSSSSSSSSPKTSAAGSPVSARSPDLLQPPPAAAAAATESAANHAVLLVGLKPARRVPSRTPSESAAAAAVVAPRTASPVGGLTRSRSSEPPQAPAVALAAAAAAVEDWAALAAAANTPRAAAAAADSGQHDVSEDKKVTRSESASSDSSSSSSTRRQSVEGRG